MPRIDFVLWDRLYILKLICTAQMTYSSFITLIYLYLIVLQTWTSPEGERSDVIKFKWSVIAMSILDFGIGTLLAFAANMKGSRCGRGIVAWIILETFLIPISIFLLMRLYYKILYSKQQYSTDTHYSRVNIVRNLAQVCFLLCQYLFIGYALDFLVRSKQKPKTYDPSIRPETVDAPTDPQITTTESRHIRLSQSFLFQPSSSGRLIRNEQKDDEASTSFSKSTTQNECNEWKRFEMKEWRREGSERSIRDERGEEKE